MSCTEYVTHHSGNVKTHTLLVRKPGKCDCGLKSAGSEQGLRQIHLNMDMNLQIPLKMGASITKQTTLGTSGTVLHVKSQLRQ